MSNTRSRSRSPVPRSYRSRAKSSMPRNTSHKKYEPTPVPVSSRPKQIRSEALQLITANEGGDAEIKAQVEAKLEEYKNTGGDLSDVIFRIGSLTCGASTEKFKICVIGNAGVGKTSLLDRVIDVAFTSKYTSTNGANVRNFVVQTDQGYCINFEGEFTTFILTLHINRAHIVSVT
jgi:Cdc6-like AAA superfamily ATPase